jgi:hypothetical protein
VVLGFSGLASAVPNMGNKYLVSNFTINDKNFSADITNQHNGATGDGFYELKTNPAANHKNVLQNGTFVGGTGTFKIGHALTFDPIDGKKYTILVYTDYPEHDNRVSKETSTHAFDNESNETNNTENNTDNQTDNDTDDNQTDNDTDNDTDHNDTDDNQTQPIDNETNETVTPETPEQPETPETVEPNTIPMQKTGLPILPGVAGLITIAGTVLFARRYM